MTAIDELKQALDELAGVQLTDNTWQEAEVVRREITGIVQALHRDLCAEASSACQEWDAKCQELEAEAEATAGAWAALLRAIDIVRAEELIDGEFVSVRRADYQRMLELVDPPPTAFEKLDKMYECDSLREEFATVKALVPEAELLYSLSYCADGIVPVNAEGARALAARIRAWRGDGGEEREEGDKS